MFETGAIYKITSDYFEGEALAVAKSPSEFKIFECSNQNFKGHHFFTNEQAVKEYSLVGYTLPYDIPDCSGVSTRELGDAPLSGTYKAFSPYFITNEGEEILISKLRPNFNFDGLRGRLKIVNSLGNPVLENYIGRTIDVRITNRDSSFEIDNWSYLSESIAPTVFAWNIEPVEKFGLKNFVIFKSPKELLDEFGPNKGFNYIEEVQFALGKLGYNRCYYVTDTSGSGCVITDLKKSVQISKDCMKKSVLTSKSYPIGVRDIQGDKVEDYNHRKGTVIFSTDNYVLIQFDDEECEVTAVSDLGFGDHGKNKEWYPRGGVYFMERPTIKPCCYLNKTDLSEVIDKIKNLKQKSYDINVGDRVAIRTKEDMIRQFGKAENGEPKLWCRFTSQMEHLCGRTATVASVNPRGNVTLEDWSDSDNTDFIFSFDMIQHADSSEDYSVSSAEDYKSLLESYNTRLDFANIPTGSYLICENGDYYQLLNINGKIYTDEGCTRIFLNSDMLKIYHAVAIVDFGGSSIDNFISSYGADRNRVNTIWTYRPELTETDIELLTGVKLNND